MRRLVIVLALTQPLTACGGGSRSGGGSGSGGSPATGGDGNLAPTDHLVLPPGGKIVAGPLPRADADEDVTIGTGEDTPDEVEVTPGVQVDITITFRVPGSEDVVAVLIWFEGEDDHVRIPVDDDGRDEGTLTVPVMLESSTCDGVDGEQRLTLRLALELRSGTNSVSIEIGIGVGCDGEQDPASVPLDGSCGGWGGMYLWSAGNCETGMVEPLDPVTCEGRACGDGTEAREDCVGDLLGPLIRVEEVGPGKVRQCVVESCADRNGLAVLLTDDSCGALAEDPDDCRCLGRVAHDLGGTMWGAIEDDGRFRGGDSWYALLPTPWLGQKGCREHRFWEAIRGCGPT